MAFTTSHPASGAINVTPLIDVLLVLLIIFMVITPLSPVGLNAQVPQSTGDRPPAGAIDPTVVVQIASDLTVRLNAETTSFEALATRLQQVFRSRADRTLFVQAAPDVEFQYVAQAIDISRGAGLDRIGLLGGAGAVALPPQ